MELPSELTADHGRQKPSNETLRCGDIAVACYRDTNCLSSPGMNRGVQSCQTFSAVLYYF